MPVPPGSDEAFELYLTLSEATTAPALHPAAAEVARREAALNAPL
ncbi:hypothetical protein ACFWHQ_14315 [Streptomyces sp. NPDC060334]|nr:MULTISPECIES: hypothetical protein [unclassified Streptomyces]MCX5077745.1 hypothetical protein [Streptomyces sp. NBC_00424]